MAHFHWIIWAYRGRLDNGDYQDSTSLDLVAESYDEAIDRVQVMFPLTLKGGANQGAGYRVAQVIEHLGEGCP